MIREFI